MRVLLPERLMRRLPWDTGDPNAPELFAGNVADEEAFFRAVTGCHAVIHLENAQWWGRRRDLERVELAGARVLASVARAGARRAHHHAQSLGRSAILRLYFASCQGRSRGRPAQQRCLPTL